MVVRIWHGCTTPSNAPHYEALLKKEIFIEIENKKIAGFRKIQLLRRDLPEEVEFTTIMWFENLEAVKEFAGADYEKAYVPEKARALLTRFDSHSVHSELVHEYGT